MKPKVIYSDKFLKSISLFMNIGGISLFPFIILRDFYQSDYNYIKNKRDIIIRHETIHFQQAIEMLVIPFYLWYCTEFILRLLFKTWNINKAYKSICFEREAKMNEENLTYLENRKRYSWLKLIKKQ